VSKHINKFTFFTFLLSTSTLLCCTIPALLSLIAGAATVASAMSAFPSLIIIAKNKEWIFLIAAVMLLLNAYAIYRPGRECDINAKEYCEPVSKGAKIIFWVSVVIYVIGFTSAFILPYLLYGI
jgi:uncharacterized membrane protein